jgi:hypothetical protein
MSGGFLLLKWMLQEYWGQDPYFLNGTHLEKRG